VDNVAIDLVESPYFITLNKENHTAYVLSSANIISGGPDPRRGTKITPIVYSKIAGFKAGPTVGLNGTIYAVAADPLSHLVYAATSFGDGDWGSVKDFGVQVYDPSKNFEQVGFFSLPVPEQYDYTAGLLSVQMGIHDNRLFVGSDNLDPYSGLSGVVFVIENFSSWSSAPPKITPIEDIEPTGEGMRNFSFFEKKLYFVNYNSRNLICIDIDNKAVSSITDVSDGAAANSSIRLPAATAISPSKREIYVLQYNGDSDGLQTSTIKTLSIAAETPAPLGHIPLQAACCNCMDIDDGRGFICGGSGRSDTFLTFVDTSTDKEASHRLAMDGAILDVTLDAENHRAFIANATSKKVFCYAQKYFPT
jgi:hypothetical protein